MAIISRCPESTLGIHVPEEAGLETVNEAEDTATLEFFCENCGARGVLTIPFSDIEWEALDLEEEEI